MYQQFFGLEEAPFNLTPDPRFLFLSLRHREAIAALMYGVNERKGFIALTGEIGSGKTTICRAIMNELASDTKVALILNPALDAVELLQAINDEFGIAHDTTSKKVLLDHLNKFLFEQRSLGNTALLIIDESQNLTPDVLEQIRMISNLETETEKLIQIVLMGQPELRDTLALPELEQLNQRITVKYHITPLTEEEVAQYIRHRMFIARARIDIHMETEALRLIFDHTGGIPRRVNVLMDRVLLTTYVEGSAEVTEDIVRSALIEVKGTADFKKPKKKRAKGEGDGKILKILVGATMVIGLGAVIAVAATQFINSQASANATTGPQLPTNAFNTAPATGAASYLELDAPGAGAVSVDDLLAPPPVAQVSGTPTQSWVYDDRNIVRVLEPGEAWNGALLTLMSISSMSRYDLSSLQGSTPEQVQQYVRSAFEQLGTQGFRQAQIPDRLRALVAYEMPMILLLSQDLNALSRYTVLLGTVDDEVLVLLDPVHGLQNFSLTELEPHFGGTAIALYHDPMGLTDVTAGSPSGSIVALQRVLSVTGHYEGESDGVFGQGTEQALQEFQRTQGLAPHGQVSVETAIMLSQVSLPEEVVL